MKAYKFLLLFFVLAISCDFDDDEVDSVSPVNLINENNTVQAQINDVNFASIDNNTFAQLIEETTLRIVAGDGGAFIEILLGGYTGEGLYSQESGDPNISFTATYTIPSNVGAPDRVWNIISDPSSVGQVMITEASDTSVSGTFSFTAFNELEESTLVFSSGNLTVEF